MHSKKKLAAAALAGATLLLSGSANASFVVSITGTANVFTQDGIFDRYVLDVTSVGDSVVGPLGQDPEILLFEGTFTATGGGQLLVPGINNFPGAFSDFITAPSTQTGINKGANNPAGTQFSSFVNLPNLFGSQSRSGVTNAGVTATSSGAVTAIHGEATSFTAHWDVPSPNPHPGPAGGIEPSVNGGKFATIFVTPGAGFTFSGDYATYKSGTQIEAFIPVGPIPEPISAACMVTGAAVLILRRRSKPSLP